MDYIVFTDESSITKHRFRGISAFSLPLKYYEELNGRVGDILRESSASEFKWEKTRNEKYCSCAKKLIDFVIEGVNNYNVRIDTIVWDIYDSRHEIAGRDDVKNLSIMYYRILEHAISRRPQCSIWHVRPDVLGVIDFGVIEKFLDRKGEVKPYRTDIFVDSNVKKAFTIETFEEKHSEYEILIQIPDLFAGLAVFSHEKHKEYCAWQKRNQVSLFGFQEKNISSLSNKERYRSRIMHYFNKKCKACGLGVSLDLKGYLYTPNPSNPINFWFYVPQGDYDKAPIRSKVMRCR